MQTLSNKEKMKIPRQQMPEQDKLERSGNFKEVNLGLTEELAKMEALRCIQCPKPTCIEGCPVGVKISDFISLVAQGDYLGAAAKIKEDNMLPAVCGRVCPQEEQCEAKCVVGKKNEPVAIGRLESLLRTLRGNIREVIIMFQNPKQGKKLRLSAAALPA